MLRDSLVPNAEGYFCLLPSLLPIVLNFLVFRLKLRCDRGIPCGSCVKRGCGAICPDGNYRYTQSETETTAAHDTLQGHLPQDKAIGTSLRRLVTGIILTLHIASYSPPPKSYMRRSRNCVLAFAISRMASEHYTPRTQASPTRFFLRNYCASRLLYNVKPL